MELWEGSSGVVGGHDERGKIAVWVGMYKRLM